MSSYRLFVLDEKGRTLNVVRPDHSRNGFPCLSFSDDQPFTLVLEHSTVTTYIPFDGEGTMMEIEQEEVVKEQPKRLPKAGRRQRKRGRKKQLARA